MYEKFSRLLLVLKPWHHRNFIWLRQGGQLSELTNLKFVQYDVPLIFTWWFSSIMGHGSEVGIIPRFCEELFSRAYHDQEVTRDSEMVSQTWFIVFLVWVLSTRILFFLQKQIITDHKKCFSSFFWLLKILKSFLH